MRMASYHEIPEFSDLGVTESRFDGSRDGCARTGGFGLNSPRQVGLYQVCRKAWARHGGFGLSWREPHVGAWLGYPGSTTPGYTTPGTPVHATVFMPAVYQCYGYGYGYGIVLWAHKWHCVTLK